MEKLKIAIIDDSQQMKKNIEEHYLNNDKYDLVLESGDGATAVESIKNSGADIVLLDLVLPNRDGLAVLGEIMELPNPPKVIIETALVGDTFIHKAMQLGASDYVVKPYDLNLMDSKIAQAVSNHDTYQENIQDKVDKLVENYAHKPIRNRNLDERISNIFITVGIPAHIKGYQFLREAIKMAVESPDIVNSITKKLYPSIAEKFDTSPSKVERAIRHAIEVAWNRGKIENINNVFGLQVYGTNEKPTNGEFIALVADKMIIEGC